MVSFLREELSGLRAEAQNAGPEVATVEALEASVKSGESDLIKHSSAEALLSSELTRERFLELLRVEHWLKTTEAKLVMDRTVEQVNLSRRPRSAEYLNRLSEMSQVQASLNGSAASIASAINGNHGLSKSKYLADLAEKFPKAALTEEYHREIKHSVNVFRDFRQQFLSIADPLNHMAHVQVFPDSVYTDDLKDLPIFDGAHFYIQNELYISLLSGNLKLPDTEQFGEYYSTAVTKGLRKSFTESIQDRLDRLKIYRNRNHGNIVEFIRKTLHGFLRDSKNYFGKTRKEMEAELSQIVSENLMNLRGDKIDIFAAAVQKLIKKVCTGMFPAELKDLDASYLHMSTLSQLKGTVVALHQELLNHQRHVLLVDKPLANSIHQPVSLLTREERKARHDADVEALNQTHSESPVEELQTSESESHELPVTGNVGISDEELFEDLFITSEASNATKEYLATLTEGIREAVLAKLRFFAENITKPQQLGKYLQFQRTVRSSQIFEARLHTGRFQVRAYVGNVKGRGYVILLVACKGDAKTQDHHIDIAEGVLARELSLALK